jgi:hypothetical protein
MTMRVRSCPATGDDPLGNVERTVCWGGGQLGHSERGVKGIDFGYSVATFLGEWRSGPEESFKEALH